MTWIIVVQTPRLNVVLGELSVSEKVNLIRDQLHIALRELLQLEVHPADLGVKGVVVEQVGAVELLVVGLIQGQLVLLSFKHLNLDIQFRHKHHKESNAKVTSSATSGPLLKKPPSLVTETRVLVSPSTVTASSLSVFRNIM